MTVKFTYSRPYIRTPFVIVVPEAGAHLKLGTLCNGGRRLVIVVKQITLQERYDEYEKLLCMEIVDYNKALI